ncbi:MAG: choice-of-anchor D domain-containing protein [Acidobacteria bacterium]|nr:choice-of-anchor D domain-containing protein [Acidobacteriota bacterium]NIM60370.1 choice-of-anchor D domain-containing protein [Acidobacteriota bacterium]NIO60305.1 choice-of-anchor D domain-containing protein [Acidobacteriota bacterium]NIQ31360.1 choice-of-anchor D domain-containing protein [Acidobacteriota bacterium]NIQ86583.1 choice-of-anchor D domain-containing protein [Acidobacteriota bacterium]
MPQFDVRLRDPVTVPPFGFIELSVDFVPAGDGSYSADLALASDDPLRPRVHVPLFGRSGSTAGISPTRIEFGVVAPGLMRALPLVVTNTATAPVGLANLVTSDPRFVAQAAFSILGPGERGVIDVRFTPDAAQEFRGDLTFDLTGAANASVAVRLVGVGE